MYLNLYLFLLVYITNTSNSPPKLNVFAYYLKSKSGTPRTLRSNFYNGLYPITVKTMGILSILFLLLRLGFLLLHTSWFLLSFLLYQWSNLVCISFLNLFLREAGSSVWLHLIRMVTFKHFNLVVKQLIGNICKVIM